MTVKFSFEAFLCDQSCKPTVGGCSVVQHLLQDIPSNLLGFLRVDSCDIKAVVLGY